MNKEQTAFIDEIVSDIKLTDFCFLLKCTRNFMTSSLYDLSDNGSMYHVDTIDLFNKYSNRFREVLGNPNVVFIYSTKEGYELKTYTHYNLDLDVKYLFDLIIYQELGIEPTNDWHQKELKLSLKAEKVKQTLVYACYLNDNDAISSCLSNVKKTQLNKPFNALTPLGHCVQHDNLEMFEAVLNAGADIAKKTVLGQTVLEYAFEKSPRIARYIFEYYREQFDLEVNKKGFSIAYHCTDQDLLQLILDAGADMNGAKKPHPPLHAFADYKNFLGLEFLIKNGADVTTLNRQKQTVFERGGEAVEVKVKALVEKYAK